MLSARRARWRAALLTGLLSGTFSTILITVGAPRIGRGRALDWMEIGTVLLGADSVASKPGWINIAAGIVVHQSADLFWALVFFGVAGRWTAWLSPKRLFAFGIPWAIATSAVEYYLLLPWLQPLVPMQVPYWTALGVHLTSVFAYPVFPWVHSQVIRTDLPHSRAARQWMYALAAITTVFVGLETLVKAGWEPRIEVGGDAGDFDRRFMRDMRAHHEVGVELAELSAAHGARADVQDLGRLMIANQNAEIHILDGWWRRWFGGTVPEVPAHEHHAIPGMPSPPEMARLAKSRGADFERHFFPIMIEHHSGAVMMADEAWKRAADPRLRLYAESLRHAQRGQIKRMAELQEETEYGKPTSEIR